MVLSCLTVITLFPVGDNQTLSVHVTPASRLLRRCPFSSGSSDRVPFSISLSDYHPGHSTGLRCGVWCVCVRERERERERESVCVWCVWLCVCVWFVCVVGERESVCVCVGVCVCERERESVCVCVWVCGVCVCVCGMFSALKLQIYSGGQNDYNTSIFSSKKWF